MCIPHGSTGTEDSGYIETKPKKYIEKVSPEEFEHGDPNFVDERISKDEKEQRPSLCDRVFGK